MSNEVAQQQELPQPSQVTSMFQVLERAATNPEVDVEKMERIYQMVEKAEDRQAAQAFNDALVSAQAGAQPVYKSSWNPQTSSWYADIAKVCDQVNRVYNDNGLSLSFSEGETLKPDHIRVVCDIRHRSGHSEQRHLDMPVVTTGIKGNQMMTATHGTASAFTYGRRYLTILIANLPTPDNDGASPVEKALNPKQTYEGPAATILRDAAKQGKDALIRSWGELSAKERKELSGLFGELREAV